MRHRASFASNMIYYARGRIVDHPGAAVLPWSKVEHSHKKHVLLLQGEEGRDEQGLDSTKHETDNRRRSGELDINVMVKAEPWNRKVDQDFFDHLTVRSLAPRVRKLDLIPSPVPNTTRAERTMAITPSPPPTPDDLEELLLITRYGELDELKSFIEKFGTNPLVQARDEDGNTVLHMVCGNGHLGARPIHGLGGCR